MHLNLTDPDSIVTWWRAFPERHWAYLDVFETRSPQFRAAIQIARRRIQGDPMFSADRIHAFDEALKLASLEAAGALVDAEDSAAQGDTTAAVLH